MLSNFKNATVLAFGAHPDDIEIGCGGTLLKLINEGHQVHHAILTRGEEGSITIEKEALAKLRKAEAQAAAQLLGASSTHFFELDDGLTGFSKAIKLQVMTHIRKIKPDIIFLHAQNDNHPDHQVCTKLVLDAISGISGPWYPDAPGGPLRLKLVLGYEVWSPISRPGLVVNISQFLDQKLKVIAKFPSQTKDIDYGQAIAGLAQYRALCHRDLEPAEAFEIFFCTE